MAVTTTPVFLQTIITGIATILPADASNLKTIITAGTDGTVLDSIVASSTDTSARDLQFYLTVGGTDTLLATVSCTANAGNTNSVSLIDVLNHARLGSTSGYTSGYPTLDSNGNHILKLQNGEILKVKSLTTVTTAKVISVIAKGTSA